MSDTSKDRHTAHISERERDEAAKLLNTSIRSIRAAIGPCAAIMAIEHAMKILGMKEEA